MDGENNGKPYEQMDDLGGFYPLFSETSMYVISHLDGGEVWSNFDIDSNWKFPASRISL